MSYKWRRVRLHTHSLFIFNNNLSLIVAIWVNWNTIHRWVLLLNLGLTSTTKSVLMDWLLSLRCECRNNLCIIHVVLITCEHGYGDHVTFASCAIQHSICRIYSILLLRSAAHWSLSIHDGMPTDWSRLVATQISCWLTIHILASVIWRVIRIKDSTWGWPWLFQLRHNVSFLRIKPLHICILFHRSFHWSSHIECSCTWLIVLAA